MAFRWFRELIISMVLEELKIGGCCGCCGKWVPNHIVEAVWPYTVCDDCVSEATQQLDIIPTEEEVKRFVVSARKVCDAPWAAVLATYLGNLGMTVEVRAAEEEGAREDDG